MPGDYIPGGDAEFGAWLTNFDVRQPPSAAIEPQPGAAVPHLAALGLVAANMTPTPTQSTWKTAYPAHVTAAAAQSARQPVASAVPAGRVRARTSVEAAECGTGFQPVSRVCHLQASPAVSDAERPALGITVPDPGGGCGTGFQ